MVDLFVGGLRARETGVEVSEASIRKDARMRRLVTATGATNGEIRVAAPEAVWALKLLSGRLVDLGDLFAISREPVDSSKVRELFRSVWTPEVRTKLRDSLARLVDRSVMIDALVRRGKSPRDPTEVEQWEKFVRIAPQMIPEEGLLPKADRKGEGSS